MARTVERDLFRQDAEAGSVQALLEHAGRTDRALLSTIDVLTRMGLIVAILAVGIVACAW